MSDAHKAYQPTYKYHASVGSYDSGACLVKHVIPFKDADSCSYRWQGVHKAGMDPGKSAYDAHRNAKHHIGGRGTGAFMPEDSASLTKSAGMAGVVMGSTTTKKGLRALVEVNNFTTGFVPYGNQVHHLLNASSLRKGIDDLVKAWYPIRWVIVNGLLGEKYNLNHFENNMILPTRDYHCRETGLPKHYGGHQKYSDVIKTSIDEALTGYKKIANQMKKKKDHDPLDPLALKDALEAISKQVYTGIIGEAAANRAARKLVTVNSLPVGSFLGI